MQMMSTYGPQIAGALSTAMQAKGESDTGSGNARALRYRAKQLDINAGQEIAQSTVLAQEEQRKSALIASRAIAVAAASGGGTLDPTVVKILQGIDAEGEQATQTQLYNGQESARGLRDQATADRLEAKLNKSAGRKRALGTIMSGATRIATTWGSSTDTPGSVFDEGTSYRYDGGTRA